MILTDIFINKVLELQVQMLSNFFDSVNIAHAQLFTGRTQLFGSKSTNENSR